MKTRTSKQTEDTILRSALICLFSRFAGQPFKLEQARQAASGNLGGADILAALPLLLDSGVVSAVRKAWGEKLYYLPLPRLLGIPYIEAYPPLREQDSEGITLRREAGAGLALDLFHCLAWIAKHGLRITAKGTIHQKERSRLQGLIGLCDEDVAGLGLNYPHADVYPPAFAVVLDMLLAGGLIVKDRPNWQLHFERLSSWLSRDSQEMNEQLLLELLQRYVPADTGLQHVALRLVAADLQSGQWYSLDELLNSLQEHGLLDQELTTEQKSWIDAWLEALCGFGFIELGGIMAEGTAFRWLLDREGLALLGRRSMVVSELTRTGSPADDSSSEGKHGLPIRIIVQPDFEILVPPELPFTVRFELEACAEHITTDVMSVYRISRSAVEQAARLGRSVQDMLDFLSRYAVTVPESVRNALEQWGKEIGRTELVEAQLLRCVDVEAAERIASMAELGGKLERIGPLHFIVIGGQSVEIIKRLEAERLAPVSSALVGSERRDYPRLLDDHSVFAENKRPHHLAFDHTSETQGWIYKGADLHFYEPEHRMPDLEELFPGLASLPSIWWKESRSYHLSTARKLVELALKWQARLKVNTGGERLICLPLSLEGEEMWRLKVRCLSISLEDGNEEAVRLLAPQEWQGIQLVLPEGIRQADH
ncbi:helicase-associated domain-containing protein [Paenibacillus sanguinis]|uniref:helicase-associated domain-containing protein n=1 Tax=Paenibacillus sanguinis TaxID=225906 RepID=UPI00035FD54D|nr:helicase-associated domain-containing protein [Paenibacillus sanguinis]